MKTPDTFASIPGKVTRMDGMRFGALTVLRRAGRAGKYAAWLCRCDCGEEVEVSGHSLRRGKIKACCRNGHRWKPERYPGLSALYESEYGSWRNMHERCTDPKHKNYPHYGGRGIKVCPEWTTFEVFMRDMGRKPNSRFTIDRIDVNGDYEPGNCQWISRADQNRNRRNSVFVTYQGRRILLIDLVAELGLSRGVVYSRLKLGWPLDAALALPVSQRVGRPRK